MAKFRLRLKARKLRKRGISVKQIAKYLKVSKSTASIWVRDIVLTVEQLEELRNSMIKGRERGRLKNALMHKNRRLKLIQDWKERGVRELSKLTYRELLIAGLALYWGEGSRKQREVDFCNSDPKMIKFFLVWLNKCFNVDKKDIKCSIGINELHKKREFIVREYWSAVTGIPLNQFLKTNFKKSLNKKVYDNFNEHYGTLSISALKPARYYYRILGQIEGLSEAGMKLVFQDVS